MKNFFRIGIHHISVNYATNCIILTGHQENNFELKVITGNPAEVKVLDNYKKEPISEEQFMEELRYVLMLAETKAMQLCNAQFFNEIIKKS